MSAKKTLGDLNSDELRHLYVEKQQQERAARLEHFRRTGRVVKSRRVAAPLDTQLEKVSAVPLEKEAKPKRKPRAIDRILLVVEILAVLGLAYILFNGAKVLRELNLEIASALKAPTQQPTTLPSLVVLPSGHTAPNSAEGAQPNLAEIPEHLRPVIQSLPNIPLPTPSPIHAIRIKIPALEVDAPVVQGDDWEQLKKGVGQHIGSANPGQDGNMVLSAHNDIYGELFRYLDKLEPGDEVIVYSSNASYTYIVQGTQIVEPTAVEVMAPTENPVVTLISCYPYLIDNKRIVIKADLQD